MPYGIPKSKGGDSMANIKKMEACIAAIKGNNPRTNEPYTDEEKIALCKSSLFSIEDFAQKFSDDCGVSAEKAKQIIDLLDQRGFTPDNLNAVIREIKEYVIETQMSAIVDEMKPETLAAIVNDRVAECMQRNMSQCCPEEDYNENMKSAKAWFFEELSFDETAEYKAGDQVKMQIMRTGERDHQIYGTVKVDEKVLDDVVKNFDNNTRGIELVVDENHEPDHKALAVFKSVYKQGKDALRATVELTRKGAELLTQGAYKYFSPEIQFKSVDPESKQPIQNLLTGGAFTNRPFFKGMQPVMAASEDVSNQQQDTYRYSFIFNSLVMNKFVKMLNELANKDKLSLAEKNELQKAFSELSADDKSASVIAKYDHTIAKFEEEATVEKTDEEKAAEAEEAQKAADAEAQKKADDDAATAAGSADAGAGDGESVTVKASEYNAQQKELADLRLAQRTAKFSEQIREYEFSEATQKGVILPKDTKAVAQFCAGLSDAQADQFFEIIKNVQPSVAMFSEVGHGADGGSDAEKGNAEAANAFAEKLIKDGVPAKAAYIQAYKEFDIKGDDDQAE